MKRILILQNKILHYRKALYNELSKSYNVTVIHSGIKSITRNDKYREIIVKEINFFGFIFQTKILSEVLKKKYHKVIVMADLHFVNNVITYFLLSKNKFIWWGPWLTNKFLVDNLKLFLSRKAKTIFYTQDELNRFKSYGISSNNLFLANNTFNIGKRYKCYENNKKDVVLFVGSFDERKQLDMLVSAFYNSIQNIPKHIKLILIGSGSNYEKINKMTNDFKIQDRVILKGRINNSKDLSEYYKRSIFSVSYGQAGLSVLQALGFGVPFLTKENAISGGEKTNIIHGVNGYLFQDNIESLEYYLQFLCNNKIKARKLGRNAYNYYSKNCTIKNMVTGFVNAIES